MARLLARRGDEVRVITTFAHYPEWRFVGGVPPRAQRDREDGVVVERRRHRLPRPGASVSRVLSEVSFGWAALRTRWDAPEVVVLVSPALFSNVLLLPRLLLARVPFVVWVQDLYGLGVQETGGGDRLGLMGRVVGAVEGMVLRRAGAVVAIHEQMAESIVSLGVERDRVSIVRNWSHVGAPGSAEEGERERTRRALGWAEGETVVLHTGNMGMKQDLLNVVEAARRADELEARVRFVLIGDGAERPSIERASEGVDRFELRPPLEAEEYARTLGAADVLLVNEHPGMRGMALPSKLTSYFTSGVPVLAATSEDSATAAELRGSGAGVRVDPGDPSALLDAVQRLAGDPATVLQITAAAERYQQRVLGADAAGADFEAVLERLRGGWTGRPSGDGSPPAPPAMAMGAHPATDHPHPLR